MAQASEEYKEKMRAVGRRALEEFRRQKGAAGRGPSGSATTEPGPGSGLPGQPPPSVELTTFRVVTQPAVATTGPVPPPEPAELHLLAPAMESTTLGALPPGTCCLPPAQQPPSSSPCSLTSAAGGASASSLGSAATGFDTANNCAVTGTSGDVGSAHGGRLSSEVEDDDGRLAEIGLGASLCRAGSADQAFIDMLLSQVAALMRDKASLTADNAALRHQVEQLTELVGVLSLERGGALGYGGEVGEPSEDADLTFGMASPRALRDMSGGQVQEGCAFESSAGSGGGAVGTWGSTAGGSTVERAEPGPQVLAGRRMEQALEQPFAADAGRGMELVPGQPSAAGAALFCDRERWGAAGLGGDWAPQVQGQAGIASAGSAAVEEEAGRGAERTLRQSSAASAALAEAAAVVIQGGPLGPLGPLGPGG